MVLKATVQKESPKQSLPKVRSSRTQMLFKIDVLRNISQYSQENICVGSRYNKCSGFYLKETSTRVFSCEYCKTFTNTNSFFYRTPPVAAFVSLIM